MKNLQCVGLLTRAQELDRHARDGPHADGRSPPGVAVHLGKDQPGQLDVLMKASRDVHRLLPRHRVRYQQRLELFQEVFGSDEPTARDRAMQLAMIGLAIASGQSPNALQNIASGALAGMQAMSQQERERRNQQRELRSLAIESAMQDISEERRLTAREERETAQREAAIREAYDEAYREAVGLYDTAPDAEGMSVEEYAHQYAQESIDRRFGETPGTGAATTDADLPVVTTQEEYDALPPGASFIQNGQVRRKPQS